MYIPSYKIHNVLKVYSEQLRQSKTSEHNKDSEQKPFIEKFNKSSKGKLQTITKKVADDIIERITRSSIKEEVDKEITDQLKEKSTDSEYNEEEKNEFVFNKIDAKNEKITNRVLISDANVLIRQLEKTVKKALNKKT